MHGPRFDAVAKNLARAPSRRAFLLALAAGLGLRETAADACRLLGEPCRRNSHCCSGRCRGPAGNQTCRGHDAGICTGQTVCEVSLRCGSHGRGVGCFCFRTTGAAPFCGRFGACRVCDRDRQCEEDFGEGAACVVHECACGTTGGTGCVQKCKRPDEE